jgi:hypothetical protein
MTSETFFLLEYRQLSQQQLDRFLFFCKEASLENLPAAPNMWGNDSAALPVILSKTDRFNNKGAFYILFLEQDVVACGGVYFSEFSRKVALAGTRTWVNKNYRHLSLVRDYLLPVHKKWAIANNCKQIAICFNEYNKSLKRIFYRNRLGETNSRLQTRSAEHLFFSNINEVAFPVNIQDTPQWVLYEKIDPNWEFDWFSLKHHVSCTHK